MWPGEQRRLNRCSSACRVRHAERPARSMQMAAACALCRPPPPAARRAQSAEHDSRGGAQSLHSKAPPPPLRFFAANFAPEPDGKFPRSMLMTSVKIATKQRWIITGPARPLASAPLPLSRSMTVACGSRPAPANSGLVADACRQAGAQSCGAQSGSRSGVQSASG